MPYFHALLFLAQLAALNVVVSGIGAFGALFGAQGLHWALGALGVYVVCGLCCALSSMWCN
jgi:MFS-type transporter involved in bile tolerance (Atg22 family)